MDKRVNQSQIVGWQYSSGDLIVETDDSSLGHMLVDG